MRKSLRIATLVMASLLFFSYNKLKAQVKIGGDPSVVDKNAVLELESTRKGFLLPRLDATGFGLLKTSATPVTQGMIIYLKDGSAHPDGVGFYFKTGTGNTDADWTRLPDDYTTAGGPWKLTGNSNVTATSFIGSTNAQPLNFKVNNLDALSFAIDGQVTIPYAHVNVAPTGVNDVLMIAPDGKIQKRDLSLTSVTALNSVKGDVTLGTAVNGTATGITTAATGQNLTLTFPVMQGNTGQTYGFLTKADWDKLNNITSATGFTVKDLDPADAVAGDKAAKLDRDVTAGNAGKWILSLFPATETNPGVVTVGAQTFGGAKTFEGEVAITGTAPNTGNLSVSGKTHLRTTDAALTTADVDVLVKQTGDASNEVKKLTLNPARLAGGITTITNGTTDVAPNTDGKFGFQTGTTGTDFNIANATNGVTFNIPDASAANRGLITTGAQNIAGVKTFDEQVIAAKNLTVGGTDATSGININGSVAVKVTTLPSGGGNVAENDYIVLVAGNGSATVPVTLPAAAAANKGRIYIVKRIAAASSASESSVIQISAAGGQISGRATIDIDEPYFSVTLISMGTTWEVLSRSATNF